MILALDNLEATGFVYVSIDGGLTWKQHDLETSKEIEIPDDIEFENVIVKTRAEIFKNLKTITGIKALRNFNIELDDYVSKTDLDTLADTIQDNIKKNLFKKGHILITATDENPSTLYGGTWTQIGQGRTLIGVGTTTDSRGESKTFSAGNTGGEYNHTLSTSEMPSHSHPMSHGHSASGYNSSNVYTYKGTGKPSMNANTNTAYGASYGQTGVSVTVNSYSGNTSSTGSSNSHNNMQPYLTVYFWQKTD